jgi:hypothetical protein
VSADKKIVTQCRSCPWRVACDPVADIPNGYSVDLHEDLRGTIAEPGAVCFGGTQRVMACHYSPVGEEFACAGWIYHQIGPGNNIWLRIEVMRGRMPIPIVDGEQHDCFEDTLPDAPGMQAPSDNSTVDQSKGSRDAE